MKDECIICGAPLTYLQKDIEIECAVCHKRENSKTVCKNGHYVCNECHTSGIDALIGVCLAENSRNPIEIIRKLMALPFCHMHGPEHHIMVGSALLTAYKNSGGDIDLEKSLLEMQSRGRQVPGGACGFWGACGAAVSSGIFVSIVTGSTPLKNKEWSLSNLMTSKALNAIASLGGPRCCKRNSYTAIIKAVEFSKAHLQVKMELDKIKCIHSNENNQCIKERCPFH
ncbi:MAG: SAM-dependent methyltransferase [Ruminococcaceae bacterium]|nr:SAM-dependent methyltransferase [Oscillospiraceae bacterium]